MKLHTIRVKAGEDSIHRILSRPFSSWDSDALSFENGVKRYCVVEA